MRLLIGMILAAAALAHASHASACWDGTRLEYGRLTISEGGGLVWDPKLAAHAAVWLPRVEAILPEGAWDFAPGTAYLDGSVEIPYPSDRLDILFRRVADHYGLSPAKRRVAMAIGGDAYTVQLAAFRDRAVAQRYADRLFTEAYDRGDTIGTFGVYEVGGFPADNNPLYVAEAETPSGDITYRVVTGAFANRADAEATRDDLATRGIEAFVRDLTAW
jgi:hypothetical protein